MNLGMDNQDIEENNEQLNHLLADLYVLSTKAKKYHWLITGENFQSLHEKLQDQYENLDEYVDETAERIVAMNGKPLATLQEFKNHAGLEETPKNKPEWHTMIDNLVDDYSHMIRELRATIQDLEGTGDYGRADFATEMLRWFEEQRWMLKSHLDE